MKITCNRCGEFLDLERIYKQGWCRDCHNEWRRANRPKLSELSKMEQKKMKVRLAANNALRRGKIKKQSCEICQEEKAEMHHDDYDKPLEVRWLCKAHHIEHHQTIK